MTPSPNYVNIGYECANFPSNRLMYKGNGNVPLRVTNEAQRHEKLLCIESTNLYFLYLEFGLALMVRFTPRPL